MKHLLLAIAMTTALLTAKAQSTDFTELSHQRIETNLRGMKVLAGWGFANVVAGVSGNLIAEDKEWKSFHQMNGLWGIINLGIAGAGYYSARRELSKSYEPSLALSRYESTKRLFLINAGLDVAYTATGIYLLEHAKNTTKHQETFRGYGKSLLLQGLGLFAFDAVMFASHQHKNKHWYKAIEGLSFTGTGIGYYYRF